MTLGRPAPDANKTLFFRRWLRNPLQMGSIIPSSPALCQRIAAAVERGPDEYVLELGAGTGVISAALLAAGVPAEKLIVVEIVPEMAEFLRRSLPGVNVICGDAFDLRNALSAQMQGRIGTAICGIPLVLLPLERQAAFRDAVESVAPGRGFLLYTYCATSPLPYRRLGLTARRMAFTVANFPPASVWRYRPAQVPQTTASHHA
ncbi:methyltransferase domain-containing protein [Roseococcus sp. SDR]|uniref:class I SAM-dependent methyltransferase n=1 Tax=Roseococcus sp. SDR TaxID=2835532 RepID=UPI001BCBBCFA|nr:methyltransferase domain-containing protein [Roseococcus sp. SDR]MBS7791804.1 methyltransferase domain-containing protein [Roseococcus sp. SDR]MBV1847118.1 methyltransferase domain-containing protein [Roseococcus sp. SDR]